MSGIKLKIVFFLSAIILLSFRQYGFAQQTNVAALVEQYGVLLHPSSAESKSSLTYTQHYLDLRKKVESLNADDKTAFENGISNKYAADSGYARLHAMLFSETTGEVTVDTLQIKAGGKVVVAAENDSTVQWQIYDRRHKPLQLYKMKPTDVENKMKSDGYVVSTTSYDFTAHTINVTLAKPDASGNTVKVTFTSTGDCDLKYKMEQGRSLTLHSAADGTSTLHVTETRKSSQKK